MAEVLFALDLDEEVLAWIADPDGWYQLADEGLSEALIYDDEIADIYIWQRNHVREEGKPATAVALANKFDLDFNAPETTVSDLMERLRERFLNQEARESLKEIGRKFTVDPGQIPKVLVQEGRRLSKILVPKGEAFGSGDYEQVAHIYHEKVLKGAGAKFGYEELDNYFFGQTGLTFWIGAPKSMKSWQMIKGLDANVKAGENAWLYSLELPAAETNWRLYCLLADVPWWHYTRNAMTKEDLSRCKEAANLVDSIGVYNIKKPPMGERSMDALIHNARDAGASVVFLDQLQYVENEKGQSLGELNDTGEYFRAINKARNLSDDGPICIAHQFNRNAQFADKMPPIENAKGSSAIEEAATLALGLWANKDMRRSGILEIGTLISRNSMFMDWEVEVELSRGCNFEIIGEANHDEE